MKTRKNVVQIVTKMFFVFVIKVVTKYYVIKMLKDIMITEIMWEFSVINVGKKIRGDYNDIQCRM
jgi:hypothetical protein